MINDAQRLSHRLTMLVNDRAALEQAIGAPGEPGDPEMITASCNAL